MSSVDQLDAVMSVALRSLVADLSGGRWRGREREVVSLFCFGHLLKHCLPSTVLSDPTQIAIEVAVPQVPEQKELSGKATSKVQVCKDIVIWPTPRLTCWDADGRALVRPLAIIEWKHGKSAVSEPDVTWLRRFSARTPDFVGYAVCTNGSPDRPALSCTRLFMGERADRWLHIE